MVIELGEPRRTAECDSYLFISISGLSKPASRTVIDNWIKTVLRDTGNCSICWVCALDRRLLILILPIEDIPSRGNWRSENIFARYYSTQILGRNQTQNNLSVNFVPI